jgi:hypothetical protein
MQTQMDELEARIRQMDTAIQDIRNGIKVEADKGWTDEGRERVRRLFIPANDALDALKASVGRLKEHLKSRPKLVKLVSQKYQAAKRLLERSETKIGTVTGALGNLSHGL